MDSSKVNIDQLARFACIQFTEEEKAVFSRQLQETMDCCSKLEAINVEGVEPMIHAFAQEENVWGADEPKPCAPMEMLAKNAPEMKEGQLVVPKIL